MAHLLQNISLSAASPYAYAIAGVTVASSAALLALRLGANRRKQATPRSPAEEQTEAMLRQLQSEQMAERIRNQEVRYDVIVVGGGVAGAALASALARDGKQILCIERNMGYPDRIIGELLQPGGVHTVNELGLEECFPADCAVSNGYVVYYEGDEVLLDYPKWPSKFGDKRPRAKAFHYGEWVMNLRAHARAQKSCTMLEATVMQMLEDADGVVRGVQYKEKDGALKDVYAPLTVVVNGSGSSFTKKFSVENKFNTVSTFVGCHMDNCAHLLPHPNHGHVYLLERGPVIMYPISDKIVRVLVDFPKEVPSLATGELQEFMRDKVAPRLPENIRPIFLETIKDKHSIKSVPCRLMPTQPVIKSGAVLIGDALNCRHPLTGGGMTVCLGDVLLLRNLLRKVKDMNDRGEMLALMNTFFQERKMSHASTVNILANALYSIFAPRNEPMMPRMRQAVFEYFKLGGICVDGPVSILGGLNTNPFVLVTHFFSVALVHCFRNLFPIPWPGQVYNSYQLVRSAAALIGPHIHNERIITPSFAMFALTRRP